MLERHRGRKLDALETGAPVKMRRGEIGRTAEPRLTEPGLAGIVVVIWCQLCGWPKDVQRTIFQPVLFAAMAMSVISLSFAGAVTAETVKLFLYGLPLLLAGTWTGLKLYGHLDESGFRKIILILLLISGVFLIVPAFIVR